MFFVTFSLFISQEGVIWPFKKIQFLKLITIRKSRWYKLVDNLGLSMNAWRQLNDLNKVSASRNFFV